MLETDYQRHLAELISSVPDLIQLADDPQRFFGEHGLSPSYEDERRGEARRRVRTRGILIPEQALPAFPRSADPQLIYTKDFSKSGFGCVAHQQFFPGEIVRIVLASFWLQVTVRRCRQVGPYCFEVGAKLRQNHDPSADAFRLLAVRT